ncbi:unnamed protein product [Mytilus edulis]|uniref:CCHC-type domain-containing protein n=1 Tax=Mytilus edulis TaxID=6550 RepID=A0A8S3UWA0_MYTED|nr:unnamed protein product [Mytilus edulis]
MKFCQGCNDTVAGPDACISKLKSMDAALDMIRWCQHTRKAVSAIQKPSKLANESSSEIPGNSPVVVGVDSTKSTKQGTIPSARSPNQDGSNSYSPRCNYGRGSGRRNNSGDRRYTRPGYYNNECVNCHKQGHYVKDCADLYIQDTGSRQLVQKEPTSQQVSFSENKDDFYESEGVVLGVSTITITVDHKEQPNSSAGRKVLALVDSGSEVTILKDTIFDTLEPNPYVIRETTMYGAGTKMTMPCRLTSPIKFKIGDMQFNQQLYVAPDMMLGYDFIIQNKVAMNIGK